MNMFRALLAALLIGAAVPSFAQATYTQTLPDMQSVSQWRDFTFTGTTATTGDATLSFTWLACWQQAFGGSSKIWFELETSTDEHTEVYYETGNTVSCGFLARSFTITADVMAQAIATGGGSINGRVRINDACYPGVGCSFYNDPLVNGLTLSYETHAAAFTTDDATICPGGTVSFTDASLNTPSSYEWHFTGGIPASSTAQNPVVQYPAPGEWDVTLIVVTADGPDTLMSSAHVLVHEPPPANAGVDEDMCAGIGEQLQASGGASYQWFPAEGLSDAGIADPVATPDETTLYTVLVTDANGCQANDHMQLTVHSVPEILASAGNDILCLGDTAHVVATGAQLYQWTPNLFISATSGASVEVFPTSTFTWSVHGIDQYGCEGDGSLTIQVEPQPDAPTVTVDGGVLLSSEAVGYQWMLNGDAVSGATQQSWIPLVNGNYSVGITDANGCTAESLPQYYGSVGIVDPASSGLRVFPQPFTGAFWIEGSVARTRARLFDGQGREVWRGMVGPGAERSVDVSALPVGTYTLELVRGASVQRWSVLKQ